MIWKLVRRESQLLRMGGVLLIALLILASIGLVTETIHFLGGRKFDASTPLIRLILLGAANLLLAVVLAAVSTLYGWARLSHSLPDLRGWHKQCPAEEFNVSEQGDSITFEEYLNREDRIFDELNNFVHDQWSTQVESKYSRYNPVSICHPDNFADVNWNRSRVVLADNPVGGVLLLHGLSDSPYSLRALGERLHREGYSVVWLRLPGHGTTPCALAEVIWQDWTAAVRIAVRGLRKSVPGDRPLVLAGYSNGGALSVNYALESIENEELPAIDSLLLMSPMIGINPLAKVTWFYHVAGLISRSEKSKWSSVYAEIDPFKYSSWPMNANVQAWSMTQAVERRLAKLQKSGRMSEFPPVFAAQSAVDSTVAVPKLITTLFDRMTSENNELFLIDVNRDDALSNFLNLSFEQAISLELKKTDQRFRLSLLRNVDSKSRQLALKIREGEHWFEEPLDMTWPPGMVSLSHVALPFPSSDPLYGTSEQESSLHLGTMRMRAEPSALMVPSSLFARSRHNPFYEFMENRMVAWLGDQLSHCDKT